MAQQDRAPAQHRKQVDDTRNTSVQDSGLHYHDPTYANQSGFQRDHERFLFVHPDDGISYALVIEPIRVNGRSLRFFEHVFDGPRNGHSLEVLAGQGQTLYRSLDLGRSWNAVCTFESPLDLNCFTTATGTRLLVDRGTRQFYRINREGRLVPMPTFTPHYWHGSQGIGQNGDVIMFAEYTNGSKAALDPAARVWRSSDDGRTWECVFSVPSWGSLPPAKSLIRHFHTVQPDPYNSGHWYLSSGDRPEECRVWRTANDGDTWTEVTDPRTLETAKQSIHRYTSLYFSRTHMLWATDDTMRGAGAVWVFAKRSSANALEIVNGPWLTHNAVRNIVATQIGFVILSEAKRLNGNSVELAAEVGLLSYEGSYISVGIIPETHRTGFTDSRASRHAIAGEFLSYYSGNRPEWGRMLRWRLEKAGTL